MRTFITTILLVFPIFITTSSISKYDIDFSQLNKESKVCIDVRDYCNGEIDNKYELIEALLWVESRRNDSAYHSGENAIGCLQIRPIMVREVNRVGKLRGLKSDYDHSDAWDRYKSMEMFEQWSSVHHEEYDFERMARNWNGGPKGIYKDATLSYWNKVLKYAKTNL